MSWICLFIGLLFHRTFAQDDLSDHGYRYKDKEDSYFTYHIRPYENCDSATECPLLKKIVRQESIEQVFVCHLNDTITPPCPLPEDNICVCVKDTDCQEIYDILDRKDYDMEEIHNVKNNFQKCGFDGDRPKYCCPYSVKQCKTSTDSMRNPNTDCMFPFMYEGNEYYQCADLTVASQNYKNICATKRRNGFEIADWGYCSEECNNIDDGKYALFLVMVRNERDTILGLF